MTELRTATVTDQATPLVTISLFPGVGLLDMAFEEEKFCVLRGPDKLWGGDVARFNPPPGCCWGVFGGPPCQDFSRLRRTPPSGLGRRMLREFARVVRAAHPEWYLIENVPGVPDVRVAGYSHQRIDVNQGWYSGVSRLRHIQFGSKQGRKLQIPRGKPVRGSEPAAVACDARSFREVCRLQGLPDDFDLPGFTEAEKVRAVGNGVPLVMGRVLAQAVRAAYGLDVAGPPVFDADTIELRTCGCGCGRNVTGRRTFASTACRKRASRAKLCACGCKAVIRGRRGHAKYASDACRQRDKRARDRARLSTVTRPRR